MKREDPGRLGQPPQGGARAGQKKPTAEVSNLREAAKLLGALRRGRSCARSPCTRTSGRRDRSVWQTTCTALRAAATRRSSIDSPILPDELEALPALLEQAGFPRARAAGHPRRLGPPARPLRLPQASLGFGETTAARLRAEPGAAQRAAARLRRGRVPGAPGAAVAGQVQALPVPGTLELGDAELELHPADGHTTDGTAVWVPWAACLSSGDYLSPGAILGAVAVVVARRLPGHAAALAAARRARGRSSPPPRRAAAGAAGWPGRRRGSRRRRSWGSPPAIRSRRGSGTPPTAPTRPSRRSCGRRPGAARAPAPPARRGRGPAAPVHRPATAAPGVPGTRSRRTRAAGAGRRPVGRAGARPWSRRRRGRPGGRRRGPAGGPSRRAWPAARSPGTPRARAARGAPRARRAARASRRGSPRRRPAAPCTSCARPAR